MVSEIWVRCIKTIHRIPRTINRRRNALHRYFYFKHFYDFVLRKEVKMLRDHNCVQTKYLQRTHFFVKFHFRKVLGGACQNLHLINKIYLHDCKLKSICFCCIFTLNTRILKSLLINFQFLCDWDIRDFINFEKEVLKTFKK